MRFSKEWVDALLDNIDIVTVIQESGIGLKQRFKTNKNEFICLCPFHYEKTPSFTVARHKQFYHCFGCGTHGNAITFLMKYNEWSFVKAVTFLAKRFKVRIPNEKRNGGKRFPAFLPERETLNNDDAQTCYAEYLKMLDKTVK